MYIHFDPENGKSMSFNLQYGPAFIIDEEPMILSPLKAFQWVT